MHHGFQIIDRADFLDRDFKKSEKKIL
jgi:hypothetical protein